MRRSSSSSPPLRFLAAAATASAEVATMSSRPTYRGVRNQWHRGYSSRPPGGDDGGDQFVSGDSHYRSVREANQGFRPRGRGNYGNPSGFRPQYRPSYNQCPPPPFIYPPPTFNAPPPPYYAPPPYNPGQPFNPPPAFNQNQQFRPSQQFRPRLQKPVDYRNWEFVKPGPPPQCERFTVLSYNILADYLAINHRGKLYSHIPWRMLDWEWRTRNILFELGLWSADILCFQEVDRFQDLEEQLKVKGYSGIWKMRTGVAVDGCAIFWRDSRFKLLYEEGIEFNKLGLRDNVAQICVLESLNQSSSNHNNMSDELMSLPGVNRVVICNIHVLYNPKRGEIKLGQVRVLLSRAHEVSKLWDDAPVVLCGDFNCTPKSPLYNYISEQKLDLSDLPRDKVSGQASAQIYPTRQFNPNFRGEGANSTVGASVTVRNRDFSPVSSVLDLKDNISPASNSVSVEISLSPINGGSDVSDTSGFLQGGNQLENDTQQAVDMCKDEAQPDVAIPVGLEKDLDRSQETDMSSVAKIEETQKVECCGDENSSSNSVSVSILNEGAVCPPKGSGSSVTERNDLLESINVDPFPKDIFSDPAQIENVVRLQDSVDLQHDSSSEHSQPNLQSEPKSLNGVGKEDDIFPTTSDSNGSSCMDSKIKKKMENMSLNEFPEINVEDETIGEESSVFLSELHGTNSSFSSEVSTTVRPGFADSYESKEELARGPMSQEDEVLGDDSEFVSETRFAFDPSAWTPADICTASGDADCKHLGHPLKLRSTYTEIQDSPATRDSNGEPQVTSYNRCFLGTVDYIWRSDGLQTVKVLAPIPKHAMMWTPGYPTKKWGSDHIALVSELAFTKDASTKKTDS